MRRVAAELLLCAAIAPPRMALGRAPLRGAPGPPGAGLDPRASAWRLLSTAFTHARRPRRGARGGARAHRGDGGEPRAAADRVRAFTGWTRVRPRPRSGREARAQGL